MRREPPVIRASEARFACPHFRGGVVYSSREARVQNVAVLEKSDADLTASEDRLRALVLARIACSSQGVAKGEVARDLGPIAGARFAPGQWRKHVDREIGALSAMGLVAAKQGRLEATPAGKSRGASVLGNGPEALLRWSELRDLRLTAMALGFSGEPAKRLRSLITPDGLRFAILENAFKLRIKGVPTAARVREALAAAALRRAFGEKSTTELAGKLGLSAKASRLLAAQLSRKPRDFGTDSRLIATLAAEQVGASSTDPEAVRLALLRQFFAVVPGKAAAQKRPPVRRPAVVEPRPVVARAETPAAPSPTPPPATLAVPSGRPDLAGFAAEVRKQAATAAQGWSGDRKAYISHVWRNVRDQHHQWNLSEIEFKCMLAEAHRLGQLVLANADLKDKSNIKDVQESAVVYRNAVFHFIRVD